jgi:hypothetical protein
MEVLKSESTIQHINDPSDLSFAPGSIYLWVIHADKVPPHLGISEGHQFFSLKANGKDAGVPVFKIIPVLGKKGIATVFYDIAPAAVVSEPYSIFSQFEQTVPGKITCLEPLKQVFNGPESTWLKELLAKLEAREFIRNAFGWQLPEGFSQIPDYNPEDIHNRLRELQDGQGE